jgi:Tfp pilus assembly protein PilP
MRSLTFTILTLAVTVGAQTPKSTTPAPKSTAPATTKSAAPAAKTPAQPAAKTASKTAAPAPKTMAPAPKASAKASTPAPKTMTHAAPAKTSAAPAKTHAAAKPAAKTPAPKPEAKAPATTASAEKKAIPEVPRAKRRDPFMNPIRLAEESMRSNPACTTGARCLVISQVTLKGVVKTQSGWIAMVENAAKKEYNLRERDTVQNGVVVKITGDSIVFQETVTDPLGRPMTREVVKRVTAPVV